MAMAAVAGIYLVVDFFERIDNFLEAGLTAGRTLVYLFYKIPFIIAQIAPLCLLIAVITVFGLMRRNNELTALKSGGVGLAVLVRPMIFLGLAASGVLFLFSETAVPLTADNANRIWYREVKKRSAVVSQKQNIWLKDRRMMVHIRHYQRNTSAKPDTGLPSPVIFGVSLYYFDAEFHLARRLDAKRGDYLGPAGFDAGSGAEEAPGGRWRLTGLMEQFRRAEDSAYDIHFPEERIMDLPLSPESLADVVRESGEMGILALYRHIRRVEEEGYDAASCRVDLHAKIAFPFVCLLLAVTGLSIGADRRIRHGLPASVSLGIGVAFLYFIFHSFCLSLGYGGVLSPPVAAWTANFVFICLGALHLLYADI